MFGVCARSRLGPPKREILHAHRIDVAQRPVEYGREIRDRLVNLVGQL